MPCGNWVAELEDEDAAVVEVTVVKTARFVDLNAEFPTETVTEDAASARAICATERSSRLGTNSTSWKCTSRSAH